MGNLLKIHKQHEFSTLLRQAHRHKSKRIGLIEEGLLRTVRRPPQDISDVSRLLDSVEVEFGLTFGVGTDGFGVTLEMKGFPVILQRSLGKKKDPFGVSATEGTIFALSVERLQLFDHILAVLFVPTDPEHTGGHEECRILGSGRKLERSVAELAEVHSLIALHRQECWFAIEGEGQGIGVGEGECSGFLG